MNHIIEPALTATNATPEPQPLVLALILSLRLRDVFPQIRQSATLLVTWTRAQLGLQRQWSSQARATDDPLESITAELTTALANDPPALRRRILEAVAATHTNTETLATTLTPTIPAKLLHD